MSSRLMRWALGIAVALVLGGAPAAHATPFMPDDAGASGHPGGWAAEQWNFTGSFGVDAPRAWEHLRAAGAPGGAGVTIAVLDTGLAYADHPPLWRSPDLAPAHVVPGYDFVDDDPDPLDRNGHGTHVASTIGEETDNLLGFTGLAYGARIMPVRVLDDSGAGNADVIARGVRFAVAHRAKIINLSLAFGPKATAGELGGLLDAIAAARARGVLVVAAAGNDGAAAVSEPARSSGALAVGATTESGCRASFSNRGAGLALVAPGGGADAAVAGDPDCLPGRDGRPIEQVTLRPGDTPGPVGYAGTSMAVPHVAAAAALVVASQVIGRDPSPAAITQRLEETARDLGPPGRDDDYGWGLLDAAAATAPGPAVRPRTRAPAGARGKGVAPVA